MTEEELALFEQALADARAALRAEQLARAATGSTTASAQAAAARGPRPAVHRAHADHEQRRRPENEPESRPDRTPCRRRPSPSRRCGTRRRRRAPSFTGQTTSDSASGHRANAST